jgi:hypothetical protein
MKIIILHLTLLIIVALFLGGCSSLTIEIEDISVVKSNPGPKYVEYSDNYLKINLIGTLRLNFKSNIDLVNHAKDHDLFLGARI